MPAATAEPVVVLFQLSAIRPKSRRLREPCPRIDEVQVHCGPRRYRRRGKRRIGTVLAGGCGDGEVSEIPVQGHLGRVGLIVRPADSTGTPLRGCPRPAPARRVPRFPAPSSLPAAPPPTAAAPRSASESNAAPSPTRLQAVPSDKPDPESRSRLDRYKPACRTPPPSQSNPAAAAPTVQSDGPALDPA